MAKQLVPKVERKGEENWARARKDERPDASFLDDREMGRSSVSVRGRRGLKENFDLGLHLNYLLNKGTKDEEDAGQHPSLNGSESLSLWSVGSHCVENVHKH